MKLVVRITVIALVGAVAVSSLEAISPQAAGQIKTRVSRALKNFNRDLAPIINVMEEALSIKPGVANGYSSKQWNEIKNKFSVIGLHLDGPMHPGDFHKSINELLDVLKTPETSLDSINTYNAKKVLAIFNAENFQKMLTQKRIDILANEIKRIFLIDPRVKKSQKALDIALDLNKTTMIKDAHDALSFIEKYDEFIGNGGAVGSYPKNYKQALSFIKQEKDILKQKQSKSTVERKELDDFNRYIQEEQETAVEAKQEQDNFDRYIQEEQEAAVEVKKEQGSLLDSLKDRLGKVLVSNRKQGLAQQAEKDKEQAALNAIDEWEYGTALGRTKEEIEGDSEGQDSEAAAQQTDAPQVMSKEEALKAADPEKWKIIYGEGSSEYLEDTVKQLKELKKDREVKKYLESMSKEDAEQYLKNGYSILDPSHRAKREAAIKITDEERWKRLYGKESAEQDASQSEDRQVEEKSSYQQAQEKARAQRELVSQRVAKKRQAEASQVEAPQVEAPQVEEKNTYQQAMEKARAQRELASQRIAEKRQAESQQSDAPQSEDQQAMSKEEAEKYLKDTSGWTHKFNPATQAKRRDALKIADPEEWERKHGIEYAEDPVQAFKDAFDDDTSSEDTSSSAASQEDTSSSDASQEDTSSSDDDDEPGNVFDVFNPF